jgi:ubiquinone/menaquinone biosynthesis C-methylase UbiE
MSLLQTTFEAIVAMDDHYRQPRGIKGHIAGKRMEEQHRPENLWTLSLLDVQPVDHILEIGFGSGLALEQLAPQLTAGSLIGIDFSHTMVRMASRRNARSIQAGHVKLLCGDASHLPFEDASFDKIYSIHSLYFWPDPELVVQEILRVLKPGGIICLTFLSQDRWPGSGVGTDKCHVYSADDIIKMLLGGGFTWAHIDQGPADKPFREIAAIGCK